MVGLTFECLNDLNAVGDRAGLMREPNRLSQGVSTLFRVYEIHEWRRLNSSKTAFSKRVVTELGSTYAA